MITKAGYKPKFWYIKLIHIAKSQLQLDDDLYRSNLKDLTGKVSSKEMSIQELFKVLEHMKKSGFKIVSQHKKSPKTREKETHTPLDKLRQLWVQMSYKGILRDGSEQALIKWASNQSERMNKKEHVERLEWLSTPFIHQLIGQLQSWQKRLEKNT
jgi:phage gp16-like protein